MLWNYDRYPGAFIPAESAVDGRARIRRRKCVALSTDDNAVPGWTVGTNRSRIHALGYWTMGQALAAEFRLRFGRAEIRTVCIFLCLNWICVIKSSSHQGVAQRLLESLWQIFKDRQIDTLIVLATANEETHSFYKSVKSVPDSVMRDVGIWVDIK